MADGADAPIIIKKVKKGGGGHHGGAWKVAYADFVTAMMAFFLLLWLLNSTSEEQLAGISNYFAPASVSPTSSGAGGVMGGQTMNQKGSKANDPNGPAVTISLPRPEAPPTNQEDGEESGATDAEGEGDGEGEGQEYEEEPPPVDALDALEDDPEPTPEQLAAEIKAQEEQRFAAAEQALRQAIQENPELQLLAESLIVDRTPEGLRVQLVDQDRLSMFRIGSSVPEPHAQKLFQQIAAIVQTLPNRIAISGHTDAAPYVNDNGYGNWELSADRANASRRALMNAGLPAARIERVVGRAEQEPLLPHDPLSPRNRRISIILLSDQPATEPNDKAQ